MKRFAVCLCSAAIGLVAVGASAAPTSDHARAESHFAAARKHVKDHRCDLAIPELRASVDFEPSVGAYLNLGDCANSEGDVAEAFHSYKRAEELAISRKDDRLDEIRRDSAALGARVVRIVFRFPEDASGVAVQVDGKDLSRERAADLVVTADQPHEFVARTSNKPPFTTRVSGKAGTVVVVQVAFDESPAPAPTAAPAKSDLAPMDPQTTSSLRTASYVTLGVAGAALAAGAVFGALALSSRGELADAMESDRSCRGGYPEGSCSSDARARLDPLESRASNQATIATVLVSAGVALGAGGIVLYAVSPSHARGATAGWRVVPRVDRSGAGVALGGSF